LCVHVNFVTLNYCGNQVDIGRVLLTLDLVSKNNLNLNYELCYINLLFNGKLIIEVFF